MKFTFVSIFIEFSKYTYLVDIWQDDKNISQQSSRPAVQTCCKWGGHTEGQICQKGSQTCAYWTLALLKMKSDFCTENKKVAWDLS